MYVCVYACICACICACVCMYACMYAWDLFAVVRAQGITPRVIEHIFDYAAKSDERSELLLYYCHLRATVTVLTILLHVLRMHVCMQRGIHCEVFHG